MSLKVIPSRTIIICDRCGQGDERGKGPFENGGLHAKEVHTWSKGYDGAAGGSTRDIDLCCSCAYEFEKFLYNSNKVVK